MASTDIQVAFPKVDQGSLALAIPAAANLPATIGMQAIVAASPAEARKTLICSALLQGDTRMRAQQEAAKLLEEMLKNTQVFMTYGTGALEGVNDLVDRLLKEVEPVKIPELTQLMRGLNDHMRTVKKDYDVSDPKVREKYEHWKGGIGRFFGQAKTMIEMLMEDVTKIETQLDKVGKELHGRQMDLTENVSYYDQLYDENENEILKVIYAIGVMEIIRDLATQRAASITIGDASLGDRSGEEQAKLAQFASNMDIKIAEYKGRLFVAWATSPQVRMMRTLNVSLAERINELLCVTIPTMRATILQWRMLIQTKDAAEMSAEVQKASNDWLQAYAAAGAEVVPLVAEMVQTPTLTPQTVAAMADSVAKQAAGIVHAIELGTQRRQELDAAMIDAKGVLDGSTKLVTDSIISHIVDAANKPVQLEVATSVPG